MVKLFYVNNINTKANTARARQVSENNFAFKNKYSKNYKSFMPSDNILTKLFSSDSSKIRKIIFYLNYLKILFLIDKEYLIYSRNLYLLNVAKKKGFKTIWEAHDLPIGRNEDILKQLLNHSSFVAISNALKIKLIETYNIPKENIIVAHDAVDISKYDENRTTSKDDLRAQLKIPLNKKIIMHTGSIYQNRGVELFEVVLKELNDYLFIQVGGNAGDISYWKNYFKKYSNILFIGHQDVDTLIKYQMCADLLFYMISKDTPTYWCCSPMKAFEYLGSGVPIIASNIGSLSEIFNDSNAVIYDSTNKESLLTALRYIREHEDDLSKKSMQALEDVRKKYTWEIRVNKINKMLEITSENK